MLEQVLTSRTIRQERCHQRTEASQSSSPSSCRVEGDKDEVVWLPIDAKFPIEDYQRLQDAQEKGDADLAEAAAKQLENRIKGCAGDICDKYLNPPKTTDFGILFLPTEGLFAEVVRRPGLSEASAGLPCSCGRTDHALVDSQQLANGFPHPGDPAAVERGVEPAWRRSRPSSASTATCLPGYKRNFRKQPTRLRTWAGGAGPSNGSCGTYRSFLLPTPRQYWCWNRTMGMGKWRKRSKQRAKGRSSDTHGIPRMQLDLPASYQLKVR